MTVIRTRPGRVFVSLLILLIGLSLPATVNQAQPRSLSWRSVPDDVVVTARRANYVRKGPGSFHEVVETVKKDVPLEVVKRKDGWLNVTLPDDRTGWVSKASVRGRTTADQASMEEVAGEWTTTEPTASGVAAAVRGFQMRVEGLEEGSTEALLSYIKSTPLISENEVDQFRRPLEAGDQSDLDLGDLDVDLERFDPTVEERQVGFSVASRLVNKGLIRSSRVQRYLALIVEQLTAETPYYDVDFDVVLVKGEGPDAFACPGGIIFLTRGVFTHFADEAQLAGLLAHEIAHVVRHHGMAESGERKVRRKADDAFAELEQATEDEDDKYEQVEDDLAKMMKKSYERVVNDRLLKYEKKADRIAAALLGEAGYSPMGIVEAVERLTALRANDPDLFDENYLESRNAEERLRTVRSFVEDQHEGDGKQLTRRFRAFDDELQ